MREQLTHQQVGGNGHVAGDHQETVWEDLLFRFARDGKVLVGKDGWLFLHNDSNAFLQQYAGELKLSQLQLEQWRELLETRVARTKELGAPYHFLVAPEGATVYPEYLPDEIGEPGERPVLQIMRHLSEHRSHARLLYPLEDLVAEKPRWRVHRKTDSHWSDHGSYVAYRRLVREIGKEVPVHEVTEDELDFHLFEVPGDLAYKLDVESGPTSCARYVYERAHLVEDNCVYLLGSLIITECPHAPRTTCVIFGDSASFGMLTFLSQSFGRLVFALSPTVDYGLIERERADVVVTQMVERHLIEVPDDAAAKSIEKLQAEFSVEGNDRPQLRLWDPFPEPGERGIPAVETVETARARLLSRGRQEDAAFISVIAYAGLFPQEALGLSWHQLEDGILTVEAPYVGPADEREKRMERSVPLLKPVAEELAQWRVACGSPRDGAVFPKIRKRDWQRWMRRVYLPAIRQDGSPSPAPETLRRIFAALLINDGAPPSEVARLTGSTRSEITRGYYFLWGERAPTAKNADSSSELILRARAESMAHVRSTPFVTWALFRLHKVRQLPEAPGWHALPKDSVHPLSAETVERIRARLLSSGHHEEATFVSLMAYAGLSQDEARDLTWRQVKDGALEFRGRTAGSESNDARNPRVRSVPLLLPLAEDLAGWRASCGYPERGFVFRNFRKRNWQEWVKGEYRRAARPAGRRHQRPISLRHTFCMLLIIEGVPLDEIARQSGISRRDASATYAHLFDGARMQERKSASAQILDARVALLARKGSGLDRMVGRLKRLPSPGEADA